MRAAILDGNGGPRRALGRGARGPRRGTGRARSTGARRARGGGGEPAGVVAKRDLVAKSGEIAEGRVAGMRHEWITWSDRPPDDRQATAADFAAWRGRTGGNQRKPPVGRVTAT
jgi:hypothetical protein